MKKLLLAASLIISTLALASYPSDPQGVIFLDQSIRSSQQPFIHHVQWPAYTHHPECFPNDQINRHCVMQHVMKHDNLMQQVHNYCRITGNHLEVPCKDLAPKALPHWQPYIAKYEEYISRYYQIEIQKLRDRIYELEMDRLQKYSEADLDKFAMEISYALSDLEQCIGYTDDKNEIRECANEFRNYLSTLGLR